MSNNSKKRKTLPPKDIKLLWGNAANTCSRCKRKVEHRDRLSSNPNILVGIEAHIIAHSPNGPRGKEPIDEKLRDRYENLILLCTECSKIVDDQEDIYTSERLKQIKMDHENEIQQKISLPIYTTPIIPDPIVGISGSGGSGGPNGHFINITFKNLSDNSALDCRPFIKGFGLYTEPQTHRVFNLDGRSGLENSKLVTFRVDNQPFFTQKWYELKIGVKYTNPQGQKIISETDLIQRLSKGGEIYQFSVGNYKIPNLESFNNFTINYIGLLDQTGDNISALFEVIFDDRDKKTVKISISGSLLSIIGFSNEELQNAMFNEIGIKKIKQMIMTNNLEDYMFTTKDRQDPNVIGYERYVSLRDSF